MKTWILSAGILLGLLIGLATATWLAWAHAGWFGVLLAVLLFSILTFAIHEALEDNGY